MLFDDPPAQRLFGIAKLAAESDRIEAKQRVEYFELETRKFIGRCSGQRMPFLWTLNPYRGCEFGCKYCYARFAHEFMELRDPLQFERKIYAKRFNRASFRAELRRLPRGESLWIGTATDPYQPAERRYGITRNILEVINSESGLNIGLTTKSDLVSRDAALLETIARRSIMHVNITVTTMDEHLARLLEPLAPRPALRIAAVRALSKRNVRVTVLASPILPLLNDSEPSLDAVARAASEAGAASFSGQPVFLKPCAKEVFLPFLEKNFPHLLGRYRERFAHNAYLTGHYPEAIRTRIRTVRARYGFGPRDAAYQPPDWEGELQLELFAATHFTSQST